VCQFTYRENLIEKASRSTPKSERPHHVCTHCRAEGDAPRPSPHRAASWQKPTGSFVKGHYRARTLDSVKLFRAKPATKRTTRPTKPFSLFGEDNRKRTSAPIRPRLDQCSGAARTRCHHTITLGSNHAEVSHEASNIIRNHSRYPSRCCNHRALVALTFDRASCRRYGHRSLQQFTQPDRRKGFRTIALLGERAETTPRRHPESGWRCAFPGKLFQNGCTEQKPRQ
jgi:hypothetical protein